MSGHELMLRCADETNPKHGGSDDIKVRVHADGQIYVISNDLIGDFDEPDIKSLEPFVKPIRYVSNVSFEIIEMDDLEARTTSGQSKSRAFLPEPTP